MPSHLSSNAVNSCVAAAALPLLCRLARVSWMSLTSEFSSNPLKTWNLPIWLWSQSSTPSQQPAAVRVHLDCHVLEVERRREGVLIHLPLLRGHVGRVDEVGAQPLASIRKCRRRVHVQSVDAELLRRTELGQQLKDRVRAGGLAGDAGADALPEAVLFVFRVSPPAPCPGATSTHRRRVHQHRSVQSLLLGGERTPLGVAGLHPPRRSVEDLGGAGDRRGPEHPFKGGAAVAAAKHFLGVPLGRVQYLVF